MNRWQKFLQIVVAGIMLIAVCGASPSAVPAVAKAQPQLLQMAAAQPAARLSVIVQKADKTDRAEKLVAALGGAVTKDLHIINAFAAEVTAGAAQTLAASPAVRWVSLDAPIIETGKPKPPPTPTPTPAPTTTPTGTKAATGTTAAVDTVTAANLNPAANLKTIYNQIVRSDKLWAEGYQGSGVTVAVVDSGVQMAHPDLSASSQRVLAQPVFGGGTFDPSNPDKYGHGTHVAGIIGGDGVWSGGQYMGVAPKVNLISVKVGDDQGQATASSVVAGLQWVNDNRATYNIRVVNLSLNSVAQQSYNVDPLDAAVEILWFNGVVVVVAAGNEGKNALFSPANDPFVITVGATEDWGTASIVDDSIAKYSGGGTTVDNVTKPDLVAPGTNIVSLNSSSSLLATTHPTNIVDTNYFRMSGTSMAAPVVSGGVALLLQANPNLTPDQVKARLMATANKSLTGVGGTKAGAGLLDVYAAVHGTTTQSANTGLAASRLLWTGSTPITWNSVNWNSVNWNAVNWNAVNWNAVNWNAVNWNAVNWNSTYWGQ